MEALMAAETLSHIENCTNRIVSACEVVKESLQHEDISLQFQVGVYNALVNDLPSFQVHYDASLTREAFAIKLDEFSEASLQAAGNAIFDFIKRYTESFKDVFKTLGSKRRELLDLKDTITALKANKPSDDTLSMNGLSALQFNGAVRSKDIAEGISATTELLDIFFNKVVPGSDVFNKVIKEALGKAKTNNMLASYREEFARSVEKHKNEWDGVFDNLSKVYSAPISGDFTLAMEETTPGMEFPKVKRVRTKTTKTTAPVPTASEILSIIDETIKLIDHFEKREKTLSEIYRRTMETQSDLWDIWSKQKGGKIKRFFFMLDAAAYSDNTYRYIEFVARFLTNNTIKVATYSTRYVRHAVPLYK